MQLCRLFEWNRLFYVLHFWSVFTDRKWSNFLSWCCDFGGLYLIPLHMIPLPSIKLSIVVLVVCFHLDIIFSWELLDVGIYCAGLHGELFRVGIVCGIHEARRKELRIANLHAWSPIFSNFISIFGPVWMDRRSCRISELNIWESICT